MGAYGDERSLTEIPSGQGEVKKWAIVNSWSGAVCAIDLWEDHLFLSLPNFTLSLVLFSLHCRLILVFCCSDNKTFLLIIALRILVAQPWPHPTLNQDSLERGINKSTRVWALLCPHYRRLAQVGCWIPMKLCFVLFWFGCFVVVVFCFVLFLVTKPLPLVTKLCWISFPRFQFELEHWAGPDGATFWSGNSEFLPQAQYEPQWPMPGFLGKLNLECKLFQSEQWFIISLCFW